MTKSIYDQLEETMLECDELSTQLNKEKKERNQLKREFKYLEESIETKINKAINQAVKPFQEKIEILEKENQKLKTDLDRMKNQINKDSSNSSKPGSTDTKPPKSGANLYNSRIKTGKKPGARKGHKGKNLSKVDIEKMIEDKEVIVKVIHHTIKGNSKVEPVIKYKLGIEVIPYVEKHIFNHDEKSEEKLPKEFYTDVTYHDDLKAICVQLGSYNVVAIDRLSDFINIITHNLIDISNGSICNFFREFSELSKTEIIKLKTGVLNKTNLYTDETVGGKLGKKNIYFRNYSNEETAIYIFHNNKGHTPIKEDNILTRFTGTIIGDHDTTLYSYGTFNCECNEHVCRYLREITENVSYVSWTAELTELLYRMNRSRELAKSYELKKFDDEKIKEYLNEYDKVILKGKDENQTIDSTFYKKKSNTLLNRLMKYKDNHLVFIKDFSLPFTNNLSEQDLRIIKTKTKISKFRSENGARNYADALTIIKTAKKRGINPFDAIKKVFKKEPIFS